MEAGAAVLGKIPGLSGIFGAPQVQEPEPTYLGRTISSVSEQITAFAKTIGSTGGAHALARMAASVGHITVPQVFLQGHLPTLLEVDNYFKALGVFADANYIFGAGLEKDIQQGDWAGVTSAALYTVSDTAALISFTDYLTVVNAEAIANSLAGISVFGVEPLAFINFLGLNPVILATGATAFAINAYHCAVKVADGDASTLTVMTLARCVAEAALRIFLLTAGSLLTTTGGIVAAGVLGIAASSTALCVVYLKVNREKDPEPLPAPIAAVVNKLKTD